MKRKVGKVCRVLPAPLKIHSDSPACLLPLHFTRPFIKGGPSVNPRSYGKPILFTSIPPFPQFASVPCVGVILTQ